MNFDDAGSFPGGPCWHAKFPAGNSLRPLDTKIGLILAQTVVQGVQSYTEIGFTFANGQTVEETNSDNRLVLESHKPNPIR